jgi:hypothetical protein
MSDYEEKVRFARAILSEHEQTIKKVVEDITKYTDERTIFGNSASGGAIDFRPALMAYARSSDLNPLLLQHQILYDDMIPTMIHFVLEYHWGQEPLDDGFNRDDFVDAQKSDRAWIELIEQSYNWRYLFYSHADFVRIASDPNWDAEAKCSD